ncbi:hypothetical protein [Novosphingobium huizhouense]|uniref:hypothetical protein n=1 Tax=Novosphingobium huizhouense TaxID=2866625 RepID=UPI001CD8F551|nr:hypothetical protein [Novosphingobium huizhouense]
MIKTSRFDFRRAAWSDIAAALNGLRDQACTCGAYAYIRTEPGMQRHMVSKLIADLDLVDHVCLEGAPQLH